MSTYTKTKQNGFAKSNTNKRSVATANPQSNQRLHATKGVDKIFVIPPSSPESARHASGSSQSTNNPHFEKKTSITDSNLSNRILAAKNIHAVMKEFTSMKKNSGHITQQTYNLVLDTYAKLRPEGAPLANMIEIYNEMQQPNAYTYVLMIRSLCKRDVEVQKTVAMIKRQSSRNGPENKNVGSLEAEGNLEKALTIFRCAVSDGVSVNTFEVEIFNQLLRVLSHYGDTSNATFVYNQLDQIAVKAKPNSATYAALINLFGRAGQIDMALNYHRVYTEAKATLEHHNPSYIFNALVDCHLKCNQLDSALRILEKDMVENVIKLTCIPYNSIIRHYCANNQIRAAEDLIDRLKKDHQQNSDRYPHPDASSYGPVLSAYCTTDAWEEATRIYDSLRKTDISKAYGNLASYAFLCLKHQDREKALCVIEDMTKAKLTPDATLVERIIVSFAKAEQVAEAIGALHNLQQAMSPSSLARGSDRIMQGALEVVSHCTSVLQVLQVMHTVKPLVNTNKRNDALLAYESMYKTLVKSYDLVQAKDLQPKLTLADFQLMFDAIFNVCDRKKSTAFGDTVMKLLQDMGDCNVVMTWALHNRVLRQLGDSKLESLWKTAFNTHSSLANVAAVRKDFAASRHVQDDENDIIIEIAKETEQEQAHKRASGIHPVAPATNAVPALSNAEIVTNEVLKAVVSEAN